MPRVVRRLLDRSVRADLLLASYPRSGNTWLRFVFGALKTGEPQDFSTINHVVPDLHQSPVRALLTLPPPRVIKSHYPASYRIHYRSALYIVRDPGDVAASYLRYLTMVGALGVADGADGVFAQRFVAGEIGDGFGSWREHVRGWERLAARRSEIITVRYADLVSDPEETLTRALEAVQIGPLRCTVEQALQWSTRERLIELEEQQRGQLWGAEPVRADVPFIGDPERPYPLSLPAETRQWVRDQLLPPGRGRS